MWEKKLEYVFIGMGSVLLVVVVTIGCGIVGGFFAVVANNEDQSFMNTVAGVGLVVGFGLAIMFLIAIKIIRDWWLGRESNKQ